MACPRIVIAGAESGAGKTSLTLAAVAALRRRGLRVQAFKVGPDFLDPTHLTVASGRPCYNLDGWMTGKDYVLRLFARTTDDADFAVVEGVMGLFDGADADSIRGSTAEIARWLKAPVVLVVNVHGMARSVAALVAGYSRFERGVNICGVIANHCGSERHARGIRDALKARNLPPLLGAVPRGGLPALESRHLGLVTADGETLSESVVGGLAAAFERNVQVEKFLRSAAREEVRVAAARERGLQAVPRGVRLGIARDGAFHFYYQDLFDELERRGGILHFFSPLADRRLPAGIQGLIIGGGYPEEYAEELAANRDMLSGVREFVRSGRPVYAECGGLMYLSGGIEATDGRRYPLAGLLPVWTRMLGRLKRLGYVEATLNGDSLWGRKGETLKGHEFHYSELIPTGGRAPESAKWRPLYTLRSRRDGRPVNEGFRLGRTEASYVHLHLASRPSAVDRFLSCCGEKP